jgi:hypothetical protein
VLARSLRRRLLFFERVPRKGPILEGVTVRAAQPVSKHPGLPQLRVSIGVDTCQADVVTRAQFAPNPAVNVAVIEVRLPRWAEFAPTLLLWEDKGTVLD